jgi:hypothetical protein
MKWRILSAALTLAEEVKGYGIKDRSKKIKG